MIKSALNNVCIPVISPTMKYTPVRYFDTYKSSGNEIYIRFKR